jgi:regulation of enolase protein 1 (concanavalin A-like superfamily)
MLCGLHSHHKQCMHVTVHANWTCQYDQGGLILFLPVWPSHLLWVKMGIEYDYVQQTGHVNVVVWDAGLEHDS